MTDSDIAKRLEALRINLDRLAEIPQGSFEEFAGDFRNVDSALLRLQASIQALIDIGSERSARLGLAPPRSSREILEKLEGSGNLPAGTAERFGPIFAFRNRVVHLYERIDERIVYDILTQHRRDLADLLELLLSIRVKGSGD